MSKMSLQKIMVYWLRRKYPIRFMPWSQIFKILTQGLLNRVFTSRAMLILYCDLENVLSFLLVFFFFYPFGCKQYSVQLWRQQLWRVPLVWQDMLVVLGYLISLLQWLVGVFRQSYIYSKGI